MHRFKLLITLVLSFLILSCSNRDDKEAFDGEQATYDLAQRYLGSSSWEAAIEALQLLEENYPFGSYAEQAQLELIFAYHKANEHDASIAASDRFIRLHPQHRNVDYAYYMRGIASFHNDTAFSALLPTDITKRDPGTARDSFNYFSQLVTRFPDSKYTLDAQKRMIYLRNVLARYEIHVANYYFKRAAYVAAAARGRYVVENMQTTPAVPDALAVMAQAYHLLGMDQLSQDAVNVLAKNFPDYPALDKHGKFNYTFDREERRSWVSYVTLGLFNKRKFVNFDSRKQYAPYYKSRRAKLKEKALPPPSR